MRTKQETKDRIQFWNCTGHFSCQVMVPLFISYLNTVLPFQIFQNHPLQETYPDEPVDNSTMLGNSKNIYILELYVTKVLNFKYED